MILDWSWNWVVFFPPIFGRSGYWVLQKALIPIWFWYKACIYLMLAYVSYQTDIGIRLVLPQVILDWCGRFFNTNIDTSTIYPGCTLYATTTLVSSFTQCQVVVVLSFSEERTDDG
jgi:hypothetical protein